MIALLDFPLYPKYASRFYLAHLDIAKPEYTAMILQHYMTNLGQAVIG